MRDYFLFAVNSIRHRQLRSWLTILGIVIGIAAIVALITVSQSLETTIVNQFEKMGTHRVFIIAGGSGVPTSHSQFRGFTTKDVDVIENVPGVDWVNGYTFGTAEVYFGNRKAFSNNIISIKPENMPVVYGDMDIKMEAGSLFKGGEKYDIIIGNDVAHKHFDRDVMVGNIIKIKGARFKVQGIMEKIGSPSDDQMIVIPDEVFRAVFGKPDEIGVIDVQLYEGLNVNAMAGKIERALERYRDDDDFLVETPDQILKQMGDVLMIVQVVLGGIAGISLLVGGIGIMNSMYTNVLERTREIGIMKSIGARNTDIMKIFLFEAGIMGLLGGIFGVIVGTGIAESVGQIAQQQGYQMLEIFIDWRILAFGILFAFLVGTFSGYLPARQAARLNPVDSLRYGV